MKSIKKALAVGLALAMTVTALPVTNAEAASTAKLTTKSVTVATGSAKKQAKSIKVTTPSTWKSVKVSAKSSSSSIAKASVSGKTVKITAVKKGTAKVTVTVTAKKSGKKVTKKLTATAKVVNAGLKFTDAPTEVAVNSETKLATKACPASSKVTFKSSDDTIATVDENGTVKAVKAGKVTITTTSDYGKTITTEITVKNAITELKAQTPKKVSVKFAGAITATKDAFTLTDATGAKVAIKSVSFDETKQIATVELYNELVSGKEYTVTVKVDDETLAEKLAFVKGEVAQITGVDQTVKASDSDAKVAYTVLDENGLDITDSTSVSFESNVYVSNDGKINIGNGVIAYVTVVYTNPKTGTQIKSNQFTVKGSNSAATGISAITIDDKGKTIAADKFPTNAVTSVSKGATNKAVYVLTADQFGTKKVNDGVSFESLDPSVFVVDAKSGVITTVAEGVGQVKVTAGSVSNVFTITVTAAPKETSLVLDAGSNTKAMVGGSVANNTSITVNVLDQSGNKKNDVAKLTFELTSGDDVVANGATTLKAGDKIENITAGTAVVLSGKKSGTAYFKVTSDKTGSTYIMVPVTVYDNDANIVKYAFDGVKDFDIEKEFGSEPAGATTISVYGVNSNGFKVSQEVTDVKIEAKKGNDTVATTETGSMTIQGGKTTGFTSEGEYTLTATQKGTVIATATFKITDSGVKPVVTVKKNELTNTEALSITTQFSTDKGTVTGIKFISGNTTALSSATNPVASVTVTDTVTIYNVVAVVELETGRTYEVSTNQSIKINK